ncbi:thioredoxin [Candidatus Bathyarchaeota archaeon]|nr:MAG: thioredoxin [Candidatus Bathyarchaeota archaeon]
MSEPVVHLDSSNFDEVVRGSDKPVVVDFWAEWCPPCLMMAPVFEEVARRFSGRALFARVNVDEAPDLARRYGIMAIPTIMVFVGGEPVDRVIGAVGEEALEALVMKHLRA